MIYIVCFIHVIYWLKIGREPYISFSLFEMPVIFFISGAALSLSNKKRTFWFSIVNRSKRVLLPYYIYALVSLMLLTMCTIIYKTFGIDKLNIFNINNISYGDLIALFLCSKVPLLPFTSHLWFIIPYMFITCSVGIQNKIIVITGRHLYFIICTCLTFASFITRIEIIRELSVYNLFFVTGLLYYKKLDIKIRLFCLPVLLLGLIILAIKGEPFSPMQNNKFPPNAIFVLYGFLFILISSIVFNKIKLSNSFFLQLWNERGYTIYLYQNFIFLLLFLFYKRYLLVSGTIIQIPVLFFASFILSTLLSYVTFSIENAIKKLL